MSQFTDDLAGLPLFSEASRAELADIRRNLTQLPVSAGRVLLREGAPGHEFMIIAEGHVTVSQGGSTVAVLERGDLVGEMALLDGNGVGRRNATVVASTDAMIYVGSRAEFRQILDIAPSFASKVRETAAARAVDRTVDRAA